MPTRGLPHAKNACCSPFASGALKSATIKGIDLPFSRNPPHVVGRAFETSRFKISYACAWSWPSFLAEEFERMSPVIPEEECTICRHSANSIPWPLAVATVVSE